MLRCAFFADVILRVAGFFGLSGVSSDAAGIDKVIFSDVNVEFLIFVELRSSRDSTPSGRAPHSRMQVSSI